jgi:hypothetical protein
MRQRRIDRNASRVGDGRRTQVWSPLGDMEDLNGRGESGTRDKNRWTRQAFARVICTSLMERRAHL